MTPPQNPGQPRSSWALQGCLVGAVALFVVLLVTLIYLAYRQFREHTAPQTPVPAAYEWTLPRSLAAKPPYGSSFEGRAVPGRAGMHASAGAEGATHG